MSEEFLTLSFLWCKVMLSVRNLKECIGGEMCAFRANVLLQLGEVLREEFQKTWVFDWFLRNGRIDLTGKLRE